MDLNEKPPASVTDFLAYRESKRRVDSLLASTDISKLGHSELCQVVQSLGKLIAQQSDILNAVIADLTVFIERHSEMQQQFIYISGQAYLALHLLKEKNICLPEEIETAWQTIVQDKILKQDQGESPVETPAESNESGSLD
jgi:hypothetical protein